MGVSICLNEHIEISSGVTFHPSSFSSLSSTVVIVIVIMSYVKESTMPGKENYGYIFDQTVLVNAMLEELGGKKQVAFFSKVFEKLIAMCQKEEIKCPSPNKAAQLCMALARTHVINLEQGPSALEWKISFNTPRDDVLFAVEGLKARVFR